MKFSGSDGNPFTHSPTSAQHAGQRYAGVGGCRVDYDNPMKRCRIAADTLRNWCHGMVDQVMLAASGLHNLRVAART